MAEGKSVSENLQIRSGGKGCRLQRQPFYSKIAGGAIYDKAGWQ